MAQEFLSASCIAKESLVRLRNNLVLGALVHRDFDCECASAGDVIQIRKPATFTATEFTGSNASAQDIVEDKAVVTLDKIADVTVSVTSKELTLNIQDFGRQVVEGAVLALAEKIESDLMSLYQCTAYTSGTAGQEMDSLKDIAGARKVLNENRVPMGNRHLVVGPDAESNLIILDAIASANRFGSTQALREASLGRIFGFDMWMSQSVPTHTAGTATSYSVAGTEGQLTLSVTSATNGHTFKKGDLISVADIDQTFVVAEDVTVAETIATVKITEPVEETFSAADGTTTATHSANVGFHRDAFALVTRPMALPMGGASGAIENYEGLTVRVTMGYDMATKTNTISFDILYGIKCLDPRLAVRVWKIA